MTKDFNIKTIAVIGGGYSGLTTLADLIHTSSAGSSTIASGELPENPAFERVKLFETNSRIGGAWNHSVVTDPGLPLQEILEKEYWEPVQSVVLQKNKQDKRTELPWSHSAVYDFMYTNVSSDFLTLSTQKKKVYPNRAFSPFITHKEVLRIVLDFVEQYNLDQYITYNTSVQNVLKDSNGKYQLTLKETNPTTGKIKWSTETFDAIVAATGRFQYPHFPKIVNLPEFNAKRPGVVAHTKTFRRATDYEGKRIVIVGSSVSSIGILEFLKPVAKEIYVSRRTRDIKGILAKYNNFFNEAFGQVVEVGEISYLDGDNNEISFKTGEKLKDIDHIIFATGFHIHFPFLTDLSDDYEHIVKIDKANGDQRGLVQNLFHYTFNIEEPTIAFVGIPASGFVVLSSESQGAAIAGVWSNARKLPSVDVQKQWLKDRLETTKDQRVSHQYSPEAAKEEIELLNREFAPFERPNVGERVDPELFDRQREQTELIYKKFSNGEFSEEYVLKNDTSGL